MHIISALRNICLTMLIAMLPAGYAVADALIPAYQANEQLHQPNSAYAQKGTAILSRQIAYSHYSGTSSGTFVPADSQHYVYPFPTSAQYSAANYYTFSGNTAAPTYRYTYTYDANGYLVQVLLLRWTGSTFANYYRYTIANNAAGVNTGQLIETWNANTGTYVNNTLYTYTLNSSNQKTDETAQAWAVNYGAWVNSGHTSYTLNAQGAITQQISQTWYASAGPYRNTTRSDFSYDATGLVVTEQTDYTWNNNSAMWNGTNRYTYTLNAGRPVQRIDQTWDGNAWQPKFRYTYSYDAAGNITLTNYDLYNSFSSVYDMYHQITQTFNSFNQLTSFTELSNASGAYVVNTYATKRNYYYETYSTTAAGIGTPANNGVALSISPVPTDNELNISLKAEMSQAFTATITDMAGRVRYSFSIPAGKAFRTSLSISDLPAGNYLLRITGSNGARASQTIVVAH